MKTSQFINTLATTALFLVSKVVLTTAEPTTDHKMIRGNDNALPTTQLDRELKGKSGKVAKTKADKKKGQCEGSGDVWATCQGFVQGGGDPVPEVTNSTDWWYKNIYPYIPEDELQYYLEPFGGALQPSNYVYGVARTLLSNTSDFQAIRYSHGLGGRRRGTRAAIHRHDFGATTHVLEGYATLFLEGHAPVTKGPGESYFMPGGGLTMSAAVMPNPVYNGELVEQPFETRNIDVNAWPSNSGGGVTVWLEKETDSDGNVIFDWTRNDRVRCNDGLRWSCYPDDPLADMQD